MIPRIKQDITYLLFPQGFDLLALRKVMIYNHSRLWKEMHAKEIKVLEFNKDTMIYDGLRYLSQTFPNDCALNKRLAHLLLIYIIIGYLNIVLDWVAQTYGYL